MRLHKKLFALFFLSGFCGLLYQVVWVRLAFAHFGVITPVLSVIVSVFMLGLSVGSWAAGKWVSPLTSRFKISAAYLYALSEFFIGLGAFAVPWLFVQGETMLLPGGDMNSVSYLIFSALIMTAAVLPWCLCMGATFPFMMAFIKERNPSTTASFSFLYLANVIGAVLGTILTADVLVELLGFHHTLAFAGCLNFLIAAVSIALARSASVSQIDVKGELQRLAPPSQSSPIEGEEDKRGWLGLILFVTGFTSMSAEVVWTRAFTPILNTTIYAFALVLAVYLAATAVGSYFYRGHLRSGRVFSNAALLAWLALSSFLPIVLNDPRLDLRTFGVEASLFPLCAVLGYLTPKIIDQYSHGSPMNAGRAYAINVIGCVIGPLVASYLLLPEWGVKFSLVWLSLPFIFLFVVYARALRGPIRAFAAITMTALLACSIWVSISYEEKYPGAIVRRDHTATVISVGTGMGKHLYVNGQGITTLSTITKAMAHLSLAYFPKTPRTALTICFGMGTTYRSLLSWGVQTTAVELVPSVKKAFGFYHADADEVLRNPLGTIVIDDGRRFLKRTSDTFDVVVIDPPPPVEAAGSSLLYSTEFYELLKSRMSPNGIFQQWFPGGEGPEAQAIARSLVASFPYVRVYWSLAGEGLHFLASMQPLAVPTVDEFLARMPDRAKKDLLEWESADARTVVGRILAHEVPLTEVLGDAPQRMITDDHPFNEYYLLRRSWARILRSYRKLRGMNAAAVAVDFREDQEGSQVTS
jgi:predicted membrane-bound spermidine synthase